MSKPYDHDELVRLCGRTRDESLTDADRERLEAVLCESESAREFYVKFIQLDACLEWSSFVGPLTSAPLPELLDHIGALPSSTRTLRCAKVPQPQVTSNSVLGRAMARLNQPVYLSVLASGLLFAAYFVTISWNMLDMAHKNHRVAHIEPVSRSADGMLADTDGVVGLTPPSLQRGDRIPDGEPLRLASGIVTLTTASGVSVRVEGPAQWSLDGANGVSLKRGTIVAQVPRNAIGFTVTTPTAKIVDLGTEFGVEVAENGSVSNVHVFSGRVNVAETADGQAVSERPLKAGESLRITQTVTSPGENNEIEQRFSRLVKGESRPGRRAEDAFTGPIPLGNLFDDRPPVSLRQAVETDTFCAEPDRDHLGVERIGIGGASPREIAPSILFDLGSLGWSRIATMAPLNDVAHVHAAAARQGKLRDRQILFPIRTTGQFLEPAQQKFEDGIGLHADCFITFDLDEIRAAGGLEGRALRFVCDRAGISDTSFGINAASVNLAVIVCDSQQPIYADVNGHQVELRRSGNSWKLPQKLENTIRADGRFYSIDIHFPSHARYLTLIATTASDGNASDHAVMSGARLELSPVATSP